MSDIDVGTLIHHARIDFAGFLVSSIGYGVYLVIALVTLQIFAKKARSEAITNKTALAYTVFMLVITTIAYCTSAKTNTILLIDSAYDPESAADLYCSRTNIATNVLTTLQIYASDALLLHRTFVVLDGNWRFMILPGLIYLATFGVGITANLVCSGKDYGGPLDLSAETDFGTPLYTLTVALNIVTTSLIGGKLLYHRFRVQKSGAPGYTLRHLTSVLSILVESAALYTLVGIIYIALYVRKHDLSSPFSYLFGDMVFICPALIIWRVALGVAYKRGNLSSMSSSMTSWAASTMRSTDRSTAVGDEVYGSSEAGSHWLAQKADNGGMALPVWNSKVEPR